MLETIFFDPLNGLEMNKNQSSYKSNLSVNRIYSIQIWAIFGNPFASPLNPIFDIMGVQRSNAK